MREVAVWHPGADAPLLLGVALAQSGDLTGAVAAFRRTIARDPSNAMARANLNRALKDIK